MMTTLTTATTCRRVFSKILINPKVIFSPWLNSSPQLNLLSCCSSINTWTQQNGILSSSRRNGRFYSGIMKNNNNNNLDRCRTIDILTPQQKMNLHHISASKWGPQTMDRLFTNRIGLVKGANIASPLNNVSCCWSSTDESSKKPTALMVIADLKELKAAPLPALGLGFAGLIPFVSAPLFMIMTGIYVPDISFAQTAYGAVILSFLGGVRWGHAVGNQNGIVSSLTWTSLGQSVVPSLIAWPALLLPLPYSTLVVTAGIGGLAYFDIVASIYEPWFKALRFVLSFVAVIALWSSVMCHLLMSSPKKTEKVEEND